MALCGDAMKAPTYEQAATNATITVDGSTFHAAWYPQMGGYGSVCWIQTFGDGGCFNVYIWHDGEFPFSDDEPPTRLHHCDAEQFIRFGELVKGLNK